MTEAVYTVRTDVVSTKDKLMSERSNKCTNNLGWTRTI